MPREKTEISAQESALVKDISQALLNAANATRSAFGQWQGEASQTAQELMTAFYTETAVSYEKQAEILIKR
jgi:hypothetical protein